MITQTEYRSAQEEAVRQLNATGITLTDAEKERIEVADFGLGRLTVEGLQLITYTNTERVCAKDLVLTPGQTCPEHRHPPVGDDPGKEETFRCRSGIVYVYTEGGGNKDTISATLPASGSHYTVFRESILRPGEQVMIPPDTLHWFQGGTDGAVVSEFSTRSRDEYDIFTDPRVGRITEISG
ncbi:MAG: D-lyxose/D-mannose family sugar isomerase [Akkermansiaceae bacterium]|nr:D-lyxose/D-mannose family sugar isomerase [Armatimonadota bacterium]